MLPSDTSIIGLDFDSTKLHIKLKPKHRSFLEIVMNNSDSLSVLIFKVSNVKK